METRGRNRKCRKGGLRTGGGRDFVLKGVCDEIFENGTGKDVEGRFLEIGFWKEVFSFYTEDNPLIIKHIKRMQESISNIDDEVLVEF